MERATLEREIRAVANRGRRRSLLRNLTLVWLIACAAAWTIFLVARSRGVAWPGGQLAMGSLVAALVVAAAALLRRPNLRLTVAEIERTHPDLQTKLLAAYDLERRAPLAGHGFLEDQVIQQARIHGLTHDRWNAALPKRQLAAWSVLQWSGLALWLATLWVQAVASRSSAEFIPSRAETAAATAQPSYAITVEPGDVELERGSDLLVLARFVDEATLPRDVTLTTIDAGGEKNLPLTQSLSDPIFAGRLPEVRGDMKYRLAYAGERTQDYRVTVFDYPELERADAELNYPSYTALPQRRVEDVRQLSVVEGTEIGLFCRLNKPVKSALLQPTADGDPLVLDASKDDASSFVVRFVPLKSVRYRLELTDDRGRNNRRSAEFVIDVVPNRPPELKVVFPRKDLKVSPLQEVPLEAEVLDDFGVVRWGLAFELTGKKAESITLGEKLVGKEKALGKRSVALEDLHAKPDELLAYHAWAEDVGPDGKPRRTTSDIYFAEVSPFEEVFREMQGGGGMPGDGKPEAADESLKLQKEIISATWNLRRRETAAAPSPAYIDDAKTIADSQQKAIEQLAKMREKLKSPEAQKTIDEIEREMQAAAAALNSAVASNALPPLDEALPHEQAAYQGLLKLRARETRIMRSRNSQGGAGGQRSAAGQELDQLEMKEETERYETRNSAPDPKQTAAEKEKEEFLNRLRELARRQEDMNQKIKELQAAWEAAKTAEEKQQLERQLKRLRDEQREMLRDVDQLQNKLNQPQHNAPQTAASKQLEQTRENVRQASDALEKGAVPQALTAGTRAESELDKLREDFRKQASNQFADEMRDLVDRTQKLDEQQQRIGEQLAGKSPSPEQNKSQPGEAKDPSSPENKPSKPGLRGGKSPKMEELPTKLAEQQRELNDVLERARDLTERAEGNEPLLSKQLYDAVREAHQKQTGRAVELMQQLVDSGLPTEAARVAPQAQEGVRQLRERIQKAAEGVLGDDVESLRRAKQEVDRLAQALADEIQRENPAAAPSSGKSGNPNNEPAGKASSPTGEAQPKSANGKPNDPATTDGKQPGAGAKPSGDQPAAAANAKQPGSDAKPNGAKSSAANPGESKSDEASPKENSPKSPSGPQPGRSQTGDKPGAGEAKPSPSQSSDGPPGGEKPGSEKSGSGQPSSSPGKSPSSTPGSSPGPSPSPTPGQTPGQGQGESATASSASAGRTPGLRGKSPGSPGGGESAGNPQPMPNQPPTTPQQPGERATSATGGGSGPHGVLNGPDWRDWSDALRNVEEFVPGARLRSDAARVREQAQALRAEAKRHSKTPNWELVRETVYEPLLELQRQLDDELLRRESPDAAVPLDRDPVPDRFGEAVRRYYERLGNGR